MSDVTVTPSAVLAATSNTGVARGTAGAAITAGQVVWADPAASYEIKPAQATNQTQALNVVGIALNGAALGQPIAYATSGDVTFNSAFTATGVYVLSAANPGGIAPHTDLATGNWATFLGIATSTTNLRIGIIASNAQK